MSNAWDRAAPNNEPLQAFAHELTLNLLGLFETYEASPELIDHAAEAVEQVVRKHLGPWPDQGVRGKLAMERLLDELEASAPAELTH
jgi:hypothetical protein